MINALFVASLSGALALPMHGGLIRGLLLPLALGFAVIAGLRFQFRGVIQISAIGSLVFLAFWVSHFGVLSEGSLWRNGLFVCG